MGYTLKIGEAQVRHTSESVGVDTALVSLPEAPAFGEPTDHENQRWPSYTDWAEFCRALGITDLMFSQRHGGSEELEYKGEYLAPLVQSHPGAAPITARHLEYVEEKAAAYKARFPDHFAQYPPLKEGVEKSYLNMPEDFVDDPRYDGNLCRMEWLLFWMGWALANCNQPVFVNR